MGASEDELNELLEGLEEKGVVGREGTESKKSALLKPSTAD